MTHLITNETQHTVEKLFTCRNVVSYYYPTQYRLNRDTVRDLGNNVHTQRDYYKMTVVNNRPVYWGDVIIPDADTLMKDITLLKEAAKIEDFIILQGIDDDGLLYKAANMATSSLDYSTCEGGRIATALLEADGYPDILGSNLLFSSTDIGWVDRGSHYESVKRMLSGGNIYKTELPAANGLLLPLKEYTYEFYKVNMHTEWHAEQICDDDDDTYFRIYASFEVEVNMPRMLCRIKNI